MTKQDKQALKDLEKAAKDAAKILRKAGENMIADKLLLNSGYAVGLAHRLEKEKQEVIDQVEGCLV